MSKTERALHEPGLDDAPDDAAFVDSDAVDDGPLDGMLDGDMAEALDVDRTSNGDLPAPTMGFAPPIPTSPTRTSRVR